MTLLFDGRSLDGWRASDSAASFRVEGGAIVGHGPRSHLYYVGPVRNADCTNFELVAEVRTFPGANSGIYFHSAWQKTGWPEQGYEVQINNSDPPGTPPGGLPSRSGSLWGIIDNDRTIVPDKQWFTLRIRVQDRRILTEVDGQGIVDYIEPVVPVRPERLVGKVLSGGTFALQVADPNTHVLFRSIKVRPLPESMAIPLTDPRARRLTIGNRKCGWSQIERSSPSTPTRRWRRTDRTKTSREKGLFATPKPTGAGSTAHWLSKERSPKGRMRWPFDKPCPLLARNDRPACRWTTYSIRKKTLWAGDSAFSAASAGSCVATGL